jgi:hypothetical protein
MYPYHIKVKHSHMGSLVVGMTRAVRICKKQGVEFSAVSENRPLTRLSEGKIEDTSTCNTYKTALRK